ncbi:MAG: SIR2 family protein [Nitrospirae bacterium]|nr:SIR2 family protein [Nitrospirota bacterium]
MSIKIPPTPELPPDIKQKYKEEKLAVFVGAGVSRLLGCIGWDMLAKNLVKRCRKEDFIDYMETEMLLGINEHKKLITICDHICKDNDKRTVFYSELEKALKHRSKIKSPNIYDDIFRFGGPFITTNADIHFDRLFRSDVYYMLSDFIQDNIASRTLFHIHGSITNKKSLVFRVSDYFERYNNKVFQEFLNHIFSTYSVLFLGYGLTEFEVLDYILKDKRGSHFLLKGYYTGEEKFFGYEQKYYNDLNVTVVPFNKDKKGYGQLHDVVKEWTDEIKQVTGYLSKAMKEIDDAVI